MCQINMELAVSENSDSRQVLCGFLAWRIFARKRVIRESFGFLLDVRLLVLNPMIPGCAPLVGRQVFPVGAVPPNALPRRRNAGVVQLTHLSVPEQQASAPEPEVVN